MVLLIVLVIPAAPPRLFGRVSILRAVKVGDEEISRGFVALFDRI
jgi:hypothetical protein